MKGIYKDMTDEQYFAADAASNSTLGRLKKSPAHCKAYMDEPFEPTASMKLGSLVHCLVLEHDQVAERYHLAADTDPVKPRGQLVSDAIDALINGGFDDQFFITDGSEPRKPKGLAEQIAQTLIDGGNLDSYITEPPNVNKRTKQGKEKIAEFNAKCERENLTICKQEHIDAGVAYADHILSVGERLLISESDLVKAKNYAAYMEAIEGKEVVTVEQMNKAVDIASSVMRHPKARLLLVGGEPEVAVFWDDEETGYQCKSKIDYLLKSNILVDLKTTKDASKEFIKSIANFGYFRQCAMYKDGFEAATGTKAAAFVFIAVETNPPYAVGVYMLDDESEQIGRDEYKNLLAQYAECMDTGHWPAYSDDIEIIGLPKWYK